MSKRILIAHPTKLQSAKEVKPMLFFWLGVVLFVSGLIVVLVEVRTHARGTWSERAKAKVTITCGAVTAIIGIIQIAAVVASKTGGG